MSPLLQHYQISESDLCYHYILTSYFINYALSDSKAGIRRSARFADKTYSLKNIAPDFFRSAGLDDMGSNRCLLNSALEKQWQVVKFACLVLFKVFQLPEFQCFIYDKIFQSPKPLQTVHDFPVIVIGAVLFHKFPCLRKSVFKSIRGGSLFIRLMSKSIFNGFISISILVGSNGLIISDEVILFIIISQYLICCRKKVLAR